MEKYKIDSMIEDLKEIDMQLKEKNISNWLAPICENNHWQHRLLKNPIYKDELIIEINVKDFIKKGEINYDKLL